MADVDHFKKVNDQFGHLTGDKALVTVADAFRRTIRAQDVLGRFGGEEFAMFMPHTGLKGGELAAERHRKMVESSVVATEQGPLQVTVSMGLVHFPRGDVEHAEQLIAAADQALYRAKHLGRNRVEVVGEVLEVGAVAENSA